MCLRICTIPVFSCGSRGWLYGKLSSSQAILEVELEEKSYAMCLKHAEELQLLSHQWEHTEVLTRTEFDEAAVAVKKVRGKILVSKFSLPIVIIGHWNGNKIDSDIFASTG